MVTLLGIVTFSSAVLPENAIESIVSTPFSIVTVLRFIQPENALNPIVLIVFGIVRLLRDVLTKNAPVPMLETVFPLIVDGIVRSALLPLYPVISAVPSLSRLYSKSPDVIAVTLMPAVSVKADCGSAADEANARQSASVIDRIFFFKSLPPITILNKLYHTNFDIARL